MSLEWHARRRPAVFVILQAVNERGVSATLRMKGHAHKKFIIIGRIKRALIRYHSTDILKRALENASKFAVVFMNTMIITVHTTTF
jgi:hypothetical protein